MAQICKIPLFDEDDLREIVKEAIEQFKQELCEGCPYKEEKVNEYQSIIN